MRVELNETSPIDFNFFFRCFPFMHFLLSLALECGKRLRLIVSRAPHSYRRLQLAANDSEISHMEIGKMHIAKL